MAILQVRNIDDDLHQRYKVLAAMLRTTLHDLVTEVMKEALPKLEKRAKEKG